MHSVPFGRFLSIPLYLHNPTYCLLLFLPAKMLHHKEQRIEDGSGLRPSYLETHILSSVGAPIYNFT